MKEIQGIKMYTIPETAEQLGVSIATIRNYLKKERLKGGRIGKPIYISEVEIKRFLTGVVSAG